MAAKQQFCTFFVDGLCYGIEVARVAVKATTSEKLGFIGRSEGMAAFATATVRRAERQIRALFCRRTVDVFPPPGPDRRDSFFAGITTVTRGQSAGSAAAGAACGSVAAPPRPTVLAP